MAWSDHKFSDQFSAARTKLKDGAVAAGFKDQKAALMQAMTDGGFEASANPALEALRAQVRNPAHSRTAACFAPWATPAP